MFLSMCRVFYFKYGSIISTGLWASIGVACSYSSCPSLCAPATLCLLLRTGLCHTSTYLCSLTDQTPYLSHVSTSSSLTTLDLGLVHEVRSRDVTLQLGFCILYQHLSINIAVQHRAYSISCSLQE